MTFPIIPKPKSAGEEPRNSKIDILKEIIEVPNLISIDQAEQLKLFASDASTSGLHRRGSKNLSVDASFYTCLVFRHDDPIYTALDYIWSEYAKKIDPTITFIEPYEIKMYVDGDKFDKHQDGCVNFENKVHRKINLVIQLSDESDYDGGDLIIDSYTANRTVGTGIFFPATVTHTVTPITRGTRFSLIGHSWGPYIWQ
jgi:hypothetical protein